MSSSKIGFTDDESKEFSKAVKQSLLVTTPLQVLLDMLFTRLQNQAEAFTELSQRVGRLEVRDLDKEEMLRRVQFCEEKLSELTASKLSPFKQQEIMARIEALEKSPVAPANGLAAESRDIAQQGSYLPTSPAPRPPSSRPVPPSLVSVTAPTNYFDSSSTQPPVSSAPVMIAMEIPAEYEQRLAAVEDKLRGVYNLSGKLISLEAMAEKMGTAIPDLDYNPTLISNLPKPRPETYIPLPDTISAPHSSPEAPSSALASELNIAIRKVARENEELAIALGVVKTEILKNKAEQEEGDAKLSKRIDGIQSQSLESERRLTSDLVAVRTLAKKEPEVSFADIEVIKSKIDAAAKEGRDAHEAVSALKSKEIKALNDSLLELKDSKKDGGGSAGMREMDTLFHNRISSLEAKVGDIQGEVQLAVANVIDGLAKSTDLEDLGALLESKSEEMQVGVQQLAQQQASLAQSVNGMATWLATSQAAGGGQAPANPPAFSSPGPANPGPQPLIQGKVAKRSPPMVGGFHLPQVTSSPPPAVKRTLKAQDLEDFNLSVEEQTMKGFSGSPKRVPAPLPGGTAPLKPSNNRVPIFLG